MVLGIIYLSAVLIGLFSKNKKIIGYFLLVILFIMFGFSSGIADSDNYIYKYGNITSVSYTTEVLFCENYIIM